MQLDSSPSDLDRKRAGVRDETIQVEQRIHHKRKLIGLSLIILLPLLLLAVAGYFLGFRILARHCTPLLPVLFFILSIGLVPVYSGSRFVFRFRNLAFVALSLFSCLSLRFAVRHAKDDYRDAAQAANTALVRGQKVWWSASDDGATYYRVPLAAGTEEQGRALLLLNPTPETLTTLPAPDWVITSKPDLYDNREALVQYLRNNPYTKVSAFPAFAVWERKTESIQH